MAKLFIGRFPVAKVPIATLNFGLFRSIPKIQCKCEAQTAETCKTAEKPKAAEYSKAAEKCKDAEKHKAAWK